MGINQHSSRCRACDAILIGSERCTNCRAKRYTAAVAERVRLHRTGTCSFETQGPGYERERTTILRVKRLIETPPPVAAPPPRREYFCTDEVGNPVQSWPREPDEAAWDKALEDELAVDQARRDALRAQLTAPPKLALTVGTVTDFETALGHMQRDRGARYRMVGEQHLYGWGEHGGCYQLMVRDNGRYPYVPVDADHQLRGSKFERVS